MNSAKKIGLFLLVAFLPASSFAMLENAQKKISTFVISSEKQIAAAVLVPLTMAGCVVLAQHTDDISSLFENITVPSGNTALALSTAIAMPITYAISRRFSPEQQFKIHENNIAKIREHKIFELKESFETIFKDKQADTLVLNFINIHFSNDVDNNLAPTIKAANQLCDLERVWQEESKRLEVLASTGIELVNDLQPSLADDIKFIKNLRGKIVELPQYKEAQEYSAAAQKNKLTEQQMSYTNKIGSLMQMLQLPAMTAFSMIFLQIILNKLGLEYRVV